MLHVKEKITGRLLGSLLLALELSLAADAVFALALCQPSGRRQAGVFALFFLVAFLPRLPGRIRWLATAAVPLLCAGAVLAAAGLRSLTVPDAYREVDNGKAALYGDKKVLLVVPHEDDDQNVLGGVLEQYLKYGSQVKVVFVTNGDYKFPAAVRINEALQVMVRSGVPEEDVIFLGYGDQWTRPARHIYNAEPDQVMTSLAGFTATYGTPEHPPYRQVSYTRRHLLEDLESLILSYEPDVLICNDYDAHVDHRAVSLFFEEAVGQILSRRPDYRPLILKGFAYCISYFGYEDYFCENIRLSRRTAPLEHMPDNPTYLWSERLRLPVAAACLSRTLTNSQTYINTTLYVSQNSSVWADRLINGDRIFWPRNTSSVSYTAQVTASSGQAWRLNDFKLLDSDDLAAGTPPYDGAWVPETGDIQRQAMLTLARPETVCLVRLYDNPSPTDNVRDALLCFDDGTQLHTGPLEPQGAATEVPVPARLVSSLTVQLLDTNGDRAGLTELELFSQPPDTGLRFIKLQDAGGNFLYDYYIDKSGRQDFSLYAVGCPAALNEDNYRVEVQGRGCTAQMGDGLLRVYCPLGRSCVVTVTSADGRASDSVLISNPWPLRNLGQKVELFWRDRVPQLEMMTARIKFQDLLRMLEGE